MCNVSKVAMCSDSGDTNGLSCDESLSCAAGIVANPYDIRIMYLVVS